MIVKRLLSLIMALLMLVAVTSCKDDVLSADEVFAAVEKTAALESYRLSYDVMMLMTHHDEFIDAPVVGTTEKAVIDGENVSKTYVTMDYGESKSETELYLVGDMAYIECSGQKVKLPAEYAATGVPTIDLSLIKRDAIESITQEEYGFYTVALKEDSLSGFIAMFLGTDENSKATYKNLTLSLKIEDGYVAEGKFGFSMSTSDDEVGEYGTTADCVFTFDEPGKNVSIALPDFSEYVDGLGGSNN